MQSNFFEDFFKKHLTGSRAKARFALLGAQALFALLGVLMTVVNLVTDHGIFSCFTLLFGALCGLNFYLVLSKARKGEKIAKLLFFIESLGFLLLCLLLGEPEGLSILWACLLPFAAELLYEKRSALALSILGLAILAFFCWIPVGRALLPETYGSLFLIHFPFVYLGCGLFALFVGTLHASSEKTILTARNTYRDLSRVDQLTGLQNETSYYHFLTEIDRAVEERRANFAVVVMDVNGLKITDDTYGHRFGCQLIIQAGHMLPAIFPGCRHFHIGGDEFVVIAEGEAREHLAEYMEEFRKRLTYSKITFEGVELVLSVASGVAYSSFGERYSEVFQRADEAMYANKKILKATYGIAGR